ncbi:B3/B4 domain-containing protein [Bombilactobacillus thymidiniphilus]|uniref:tRNA ligase n=1 Tax=Bombilactobacillus thymidiniphilus TaxID=2923363 RepID=A0ABY4PER7_9LACO|nr:phenylalanine--tRNA ligase beta subunit-related protein [Bombilactobacillus thymidiniphilus]UQS84006.1 tRNA ligase [Bombilactobacillus thymidiniphilus]
MKQFNVQPAFWQIFPEAEIVGLVVDNVDNTGALPAKLLTTANEKAQQWVPNDPISANPVVQDWRKAYQQFKTKKGARSAVENLLKRAKQGKGVTSINPAVDLYNAVALTWAFPIGGQDLTKIQGNIELTVAQGGEEFIPIGEANVESALMGEVIYQDGESVICRCFNWRDSSRVEITSTTHQMIFYMENINPQRHNEVIQALELLQTYLQTYLQVTAKSFQLTKDHPQADLQALLYD